MSIKSLFGNSSVYAVANLLQRGITFFLIPVYARYLSQAEFGAMDVIYQTIFLLVLISSMGLTQGLARGYHLDNPTESDRKKMLGALLCLIFPIMIVVAGALYFSSDFLTLLIFGEEGKSSWLRLAVLFFVCISLQQLPMQLLRTRQKAKPYALWSLVGSIVIVVGNVVMLIKYKMGLEGMIWANIAGYGLMAMCLMPEFLKHIQINFEFRRLKTLFAFGIPMLPALMARKVLEISDRYVLPQYHALDELALYNMGAKVSNLLEVLILVPFLYAWQPFFYAQANNPKAPELFARIARYLFIILLTMFLAVEVVKTPMVLLLGGESYAQADSVITLLVLAVVFNGIQYSISPGIHLKKKLVQEALIMIACAVLNLFLNYLLIPGQGRDGAALATVITYGIYFLCTLILSQHFYKVNYPWFKMTKILCLAVLCYWALSISEELWVKIGIFLLFLVVGPILELSEDQQFRSFLSRKKNK